MNPNIKEIWFEIGVLLGLPVAKLQNIEELHGKDLNSSCMMMLIEWSLAKSATWGNLLSVIDRVPFKSANTVESNDKVDLTLELKVELPIYCYNNYVHQYGYKSS